MQVKSAKQYLDEIDAKFFEAKRDRLSRLDPRWGVWSGEMNREIRRIVSELDGKDQQAAVRYKLTFFYWATCSRIIEALYRGRGIFGRAKIKRDQKVLVNLRRQILSSGQIEDVDFSPEGVADSIFGGIVKLGRKHKRS